MNEGKCYGMALHCLLDFSLHNNVVLRGIMLNRTYGTYKNLYISPFILQNRFGPIYYVSYYCSDIRVCKEISFITTPVASSFRVSRWPTAITAVVGFGVRQSFAFVVAACTRLSVAVLSIEPIYIQVLPSEWHDERSV